MLTGQAISTALAGYDSAASALRRKEERQWRMEDLEWRALEQEFMTQERWFMEQEHQFRISQLNQVHAANARVLWNRHVEKCRRDLYEKTEQLKAVSNLAALTAGFALVAFLEFQFTYVDTTHVVLPFFGFTTAATVAFEMASVVLCSLILASILKTGKEYVSEDEEAEFMYKCQLYAARYKVGDRPPAPQRSFAVHWNQRCEDWWRLAFCLFFLGIPCFFINLAFAGWIKFSNSVPAATIVTVVMAASLVFTLSTSKRWSRHILKTEELHVNRLALEPAGLPFDWHLPPSNPYHTIGGDVSAEAAMV